MRRCACGRESHKRTGGEWVCPRCDAIEHQWAMSSTNDRKYERVVAPRSFQSLPRWACASFVDVQIGAAAFWARRGISEPVEVFNSMNGGQL